MGKPLSPPSATDSYESFQDEEMENEEENDVICMNPETQLNLEERDPIIIEQYKIWKKNAPYLYDLLITTAIELPSLTVEWIPESPRCIANGYHQDYRLVLGTQTTGNLKDKNYLIIYKALVPEIDLAKSHYKESTNGYGGVSAKIEPFVKIRHDGDVNRARSNPSNTFLIATKTSTNKVLIFDYSKHGTEKDSDACQSELTLLGHQKEGYGLCWNPREANLLLSGSEDGQLCIWDIDTSGKKYYCTLDPIGNYHLPCEQQPNFIVTDCQWHYFHKNLFGSVGTDRYLRLWDTRKQSNSESIISTVAHEDDINAISFNPFNPYLVLTASADRTIALWDVRNVSQSLHRFHSHEDEILQVCWSPNHESVFASGGRDRQIHYWNIEAIQPDQQSNEPFYIHGGHTNIVSDFSWHPTNHWLMASVSDENELHVWKIAESNLPTFKGKQQQQEQSSFNDSNSSIGITS
ncbi:hypothetical protein RDWZM_006454 [Blomia tropicalis]|uniref:Histone-binding protein RBBP4-like N-terminal domain-containing protein n=1 Tax=Blomia tropicalis TaxID=40697 RepID=A0A9Q0M7X8_BLOTA|nr:Histone-binding protein rbbp4 [Blomia tropicalis]KAJ6220642.1 hypothetical protein RDWZM_006454 [Blomia tropicalis]